MSTLTVDGIIDVIIKKEGSRYENVPGDRGGPTKFGITLGRLRTERGKHMTWEDVRDLTEPEAREIYKDAYYRRPKIDLLPEPIQAAVMDFYTTSGTWAITRLQEMLTDMGFEKGSPGVIDGQTLDAVEKAYEAMGDDLVRAYAVERAHFFGRIVANDESQGKFIRGWVNQRARPFFEGRYK